MLGSLRTTSRIRTRHHDDTPSRNHLMVALRKQNHLLYVHIKLSLASQGTLLPLTGSSPPAAF